MKNNNPLHDDPMLTAYALGELNATEAAAIELQLANNPAAKAAVDEIRQTASALKHEFAIEAGPGLTHEQVERLQHRPEPVAPVSPAPILLRAQTIWWGVGVAAAACLTITSIVTWPTKQADSIARIELNHTGPDTVERSLTQLQDELGANREIMGGAGGGGGAGGLNEDDRARANSRSGNINELNTLANTPTSQTDTAVLSIEGSHSKSIMPGSLPSVAATSPPPPPAPPGTSTATGAGSRLEDPSRVAALHSEVITGKSLFFKASEALESEQADRSVRGNNIAGENYKPLTDNAFIAAAEPSTFSVDVDTASYSNVRRMIQSGSLPPKDAVRIEEMINYFQYHYEAPTGEHPFSANIEVNASPWKADHRLVRIGVRGKDIPVEHRPPTNLVFLVDVSGSMNEPTKLPLVKDSLKLLLNQLNADDRLAIVTYAGDAGVLQDSIFCSPENRAEIAQKIDALGAGGSTNGAGGINAAYELATRGYIKGGVNRIILCTDGDFNVGASSEEDLINIIHDKRATGVYLSILGFGSGNWQDAKMKELSKHGNGNFAYIDTLDEARKSLVDQMSGTLVTIAKDVKVQVQFNPEKVKEYRLIGYENRILQTEDFTNDRIDAGEIGASHTVTALYEIVPNTENPIVDSFPIGTLRLRYKKPEGDESQPLEFAIADEDKKLDAASHDFKFAASVAAFGMILRDSPHKGDASIGLVLDLAQPATFGLEPSVSETRLGFLELVNATRQLLEAAKPNE